MSATSSSTILGALSKDATFGESFSFLLAGFAVVMMTLLALAIVCMLVGSLFQKFPALAGKPKPEQVVPRQRRPMGAADDPVLLAVVGAAVDQALGGRYRIKRITPLGEKKSG